jgi:FkbM family methyltransferase
MLKFQQIYNKSMRRFRFHFLWYIQCLFIKDPVFSFFLNDGSRFDYPLKNVVGRLLFSGVFELEEIEFIRQILKPGDIFFDVGANGGLYTIIAAKLVGENGHVYSFEPGERELKLLHHNIAINNLTNVTVIESAVSNIKGKTNFAISVDGAMNSLLKTNHPLQKIQEWQKIEVTTLDDVVDELSVKKVNFLKIDVEGAEKQVLDGAKILLESQKEIVILFEASDSTALNFGYSVRDILSEIISSGFFIYQFNELGNLINISENELGIIRKNYNYIASKIPITNKSL